MKKFSVLAAILVVATVVLTSVGCAGLGVVSSWKGEFLSLGEQTKATLEKEGIKVNKNSAEAIFYNDNTFKVLVEVDLTIPEEAKQLAGGSIPSSMKGTMTGSYTGDAVATSGILTLTVNNVGASPSDSGVGFVKGSTLSAEINGDQINMLIFTLERQ